MNKLSKKIKLALEAKSGAITLFYAFINGKKVIAEDGTKKREWEGNIEPGETRLKVRVIGIDDAQYTLNLDLPGTADDQSITFSLEGGYHEFELSI